jgi:Skp family chaperone for outer membrane proteins
LEEVRAKNPDEYTEISDILSRYRTLQNSQAKLDNELKKKETELSDKRTELATYEKNMDTDIMTLNN